MRLNNQQNKRKVRRVARKASRRNVTRKMQQLSLADYAAGAGQLVGRHLGRAVGGGLSRILGMGAYSVQTNSLTTQSLVGQVPAMHIDSESIVLRRREYLGDIVSSSTANTFSVQSFALNPGLESTFPLGSAVAQQYQEWRPRGICLDFHSESANALNSTNTALGSVMAMVAYRPTQPAPTSKLAMLNEMWALETKPCEGMIIPVECAMNQTPLTRLFVRGGGVPNGEDQKTYDLGTFYIATTGMQGTSVNVGSLWITYEIELYKPIPTLLQGLWLNAAHYNCTGVSFASTSTMLNNFVKVADNIGLTLGGNTIAFPPGCVGDYFVSVTWNNSSSSFNITFGASLTLTNCTQRTPFVGYSAGALATGNNALASACGGATGYGLQFQSCFNITNPSAAAYIQFPAFSGTATTAGSAGDVFVMQVPTAVM